MPNPHNTIVTCGIVLARTDFQEADRILTVLTPDKGKIRLIAKGVRRPRSKLAGGIELFSISDLTVLPRRGELQTLISSRLSQHFANIVKDIKRTMLGYELLKRINRVTEDAAGEEYFTLLSETLAGLDDLELPLELIELWFGTQLLVVTGHAPELKLDTAGAPLRADGEYVFDYDSMAFTARAGAPFRSNHIKLLRLAYAAGSPKVLGHIKDAESCVPGTLQLVQNLLRLSVR